MARWAYSATLAVSLAACTGQITKKDCERADYYEMGLKDGRSGRNDDRIQEFKRGCAAVGGVANETKYRTGRHVGLSDYCDERRAEKDAREGISNSVCLQEKMPAYEVVYARALEKRVAQ